MRGGVYQIRNVATGARYVGSAVDFARRRRNHFSLLRGGRHHSVHLQRAYNRYGESEFVFETLVVCSPDYGLALEQRLLEAGAGEYNISFDAKAPMRGRKHSPAACGKIRAARTGVARPDQSVAARALWQSAKYRAKVSTRGKPKSPEHAKKLAAHLAAARLDQSRIRRVHKALHGKGA